MKFNIMKIFKKNKKFEKLYTDFSNKIYYLSKIKNIKKVHLKTFLKYKDINKGKNVVLIATGPSLKDFKPVENAVYVGVNKAFKYDKVSFDYLFLQDYSGAKDYIEDFLHYKEENTKKFLGITDSKYSSHCIIPEKYFSYKNVEKYYAMLCLIQKNIPLNITSSPLYDKFSIVFPAMQFILWTHPEKILLVGCDCNLNGYFDSKNPCNSLDVNNVLKGWEKMKTFVETYYPDIEIISVNPKGLKGLFKDEYTVK